MIRIGNLSQEIEKGIFQSKKIIVLGAGKDGKEACKNLVQHGIEVKCFVDEDEKKWGREYLKVGVESPHKMSLLEKQEYCFLLCIGVISFLDDKKIIQNAFVKKMELEDAPNLIILDRSQSIHSTFMRCLKKDDVLPEEEVLDLNGIKIPNFLTGFNEKIMKVFLTECCDLILPYIFNEYSEVDEGPYEEGNFQVESGDIVFDCGANLGLFSAIVANRASKVFAFEPIPNSIALLKQTQRLYKNINICNVAVSDTIGKVQMVSEESLGQNRIVRSTLDLSANLIDVASTTIDDFVRENNIERVDFIKADIEGAERKLLKGAKKVLKEFAPRLVLCTYHLDDDPIVLEKLIKEANSNYIVEHKYKKLYAYVKSL